MSVEYDWGIIGNWQATTFLQKSLDSDRPAHAYLFTGPGLVGKTKLAKRFANILICDKRISALAQKASMILPCGECPRCREWKRGIYADVYWLERELRKDGEKLADVITVAQVRTLIDKLGKRSFGDSYKVIIVPNAEALGAEASNGLLKTLEEPGDRTVMILIAPHKDSVLPTICSRCQEVRFFPVKADEIYKKLVESGVSRDIAGEVSKVSHGRPTMAEKFTASPEEYSVYKERILSAAKLLGAGAAGRLRLTGEISETVGNDKEEWRRLIDGLLGISRDALLLKIGREDLMVNIFAHKEIESLAAVLNIAELSRTIWDLLRLEALLETNANIKMNLDAILLSGKINRQI
jgi:DNA polymerase-3 subunit delta'